MFSHGQGKPPRRLRTDRSLMSVRSYCRTAIKLFSKGFIFANPRLAAASASTVHPPRQYWDCAYFSGIAIDAMGSVSPSTAMMGYNDGTQWADHGKMDSSTPPEVVLSFESRAGAICKLRLWEFYDKSISTDLATIYQITYMGPQGKPLREDLYRWRAAGSSKTDASKLLSILGNG